MQGASATSKKFFTPFGLILFTLSVIYIAAEAVFNMKLLEVAGSVKSNPAEINDLQYFGRTVSAYGFSLLILGLFETTGFRLRTRKDWALFFGVAVVCILPFISIFKNTFPAGTGEGYSAPLALEPLDVMMSIMPCLGVLVAIMSAGRFRPQMFIALLLMAWPAMFLGQKLLIERYVVDRTDWQERQDARYMLMLRAGLEDCALYLGDLQLCNDSEGAPDMKAARIITSALWMMNPDAVLQDLRDNRDMLVESAAVRGVWFSPQEQYKKYTEKVTDARDQYAKDLTQKFYSKYYGPYKRASDMYQNALDPVVIGREADKAVAEIDAQMEAGWQKYLSGVHDFKQQVSVMVGQAIRQTMNYAGQINDLCNKRGDCPDVDSGDGLQRAQAKAVREFTIHSGYPPDITDKAEFLSYPKTRKMVREQVQQTLRYKFDLKDFTLPDDWVYDPKTFKETISTLVAAQARGKWKEKFGDKLPPGLDENGFMNALGIDPTLPPVEKMLMTQDMFFKKYVLPGNQRLIDMMLAELSSDRKKHKDDAVEMEEGKDYVKALYIPTISLVVSLGVVMMTLFRGLMLLPEALIRSGKVKVDASPKAIRAGLAGAFLSVLMLMPLAAPNPYAAGTTYHRYLQAARENHMFVASLLNWAVQVQPVIYRAGNGLRAAFQK